MKPHFDPILHDLASQFKLLPEFPEADPDRAYELVEDGVPLRHIAKMAPPSTFYGVRFKIARRVRYLAYAPKERLDDGLRFADACTLRFWKYRRRHTSQPQPDDAQFNSNYLGAVQADLADWAEGRKDILALIDDIENHFLATEVFTDPNETPIARPANTVLGRIAELQAIVEENHQQIIHLLGERNAGQPVKST